MKDQKAHRESGQALITVALLMVVMLLFLALAVDVGLIYQERRRMQNAADAGALAGARELCFGDPGQAEYVAEDYAQRNGAQTVNVTIVDYTVNVVASVDANTIFAGIIGMDTVDVGAVAEAACGSARSACGLWPVAFSLERWNYITTTRPCGESFYVWAGDNLNNDPDCTVYDCDVDHNGTQDVLESQNRAWLDFSDVADLDVEHPDDCLQPGCGAMELKCWLASDAGAQIHIPACIAGDTGVKAGVKAAVDSRFEQDVGIPLYDYVGCGGVTCPGTSVYVQNFGCITVLGWVHQLTLPRLDGGTPAFKDKAIKAAVACKPCVTYCGAADTAPPIPGGIKTVSLTK